MLWGNIDIVVVHLDLVGAAEEKCGLDVEAMGDEFTKYSAGYANLLINLYFDNFVFFA